MEIEDSSETKNASSAPKVPLLLTMAPMIHYSGMRTPPHHTLASIPFQWEEEPGKPRPCTSLIPFLPNTNNSDQPRCLELPPRLLGQKKITSTKTSSSPVTVLDGPYYVGRSKFISSSFRLFRERFDSSSGSDEEEKENVGYEGKKLQKRRGFFGSTWKRNKYSDSYLLKAGAGAGRGRKEVGSISFGYGSSTMEKTSLWCSDDGSRRISNVTKNGSFANLSQASSHFWAAMYEGIKQVIPWKSKKSKK